MGEYTTAIRAATRHNITVQARTTAMAQSAVRAGWALLSLLIARVVAVLEAIPPINPVSAMPSLWPKSRTATYPPNEAPETRTTISQMEWGLKAPCGPHGSSGTKGRITPVMAANCSAIRTSSLLNRRDTWCT